jgi:hypothetical protein
VDGEWAKIVRSFTVFKNPPLARLAGTDPTSTSGSVRSPESKGTAWQSKESHRNRNHAMGVR